MSGKKQKGARKTKQLPKAIRDELRMACAMRGYSQVKCGGGKKLKTQYVDLNNFYHGIHPTHPSQIELLANAAPSYSTMNEHKLPPTRMII